jgi:transposase InsO family protein
LIVFLVGWSYSAATDYSAQSAALALLSFVGRFGVPTEIHSDRGTQYINDIIEQFIKLIGGTQTLNISSYSHEENAMVERVNKEILRHMRALIFDKKTISDWATNLPIVQRILNVSENESIGTSATRILFGNTIDTDNMGIFLPQDERPQFENLSPWLAERLSAQDAIIKCAQALQQKRNALHVSTTNKTLSHYAIDDYVLVDYPASNNHVGPPSKFMTHRRGPMKIVKRDGITIHYWI